MTHIILCILKEADDLGGDDYDDDEDVDEDFNSDIYDDDALNDQNM